MSAPYDHRASRRPVNLYLNEDLIQRVRGLGGNLSDRVEGLLAVWLETELARRAEADKALDGAVAAWNEFGEQVGSFADEHSTL